MHTSYRNELVHVLHAYELNMFWQYGYKFQNSSEMFLFFNEVIMLSLYFDLHIWFLYVQTCSIYLVFLYILLILTKTHINPPQRPKVFARRDGQNSGCSTSLVVDLGRPQGFQVTIVGNESTSQMHEEDIIFKKLPFLGICEFLGGYWFAMLFA